MWFIFRYVHFTMAGFSLLMYCKITTYFILNTSIIHVYYYCKINIHEVQYQRKVTVTLLQDCTIDELQAELPISQPRYLVISYVRNHSDGRVSYPLCFVFSSPVGEYFTNLPTTIFTCSGGPFQNHEANIIQSLNNTAWSREFKFAQMKNHHKIAKMCQVSKIPPHFHPNHSCEKKIEIYSWQMKGEQLFERRQKLMLTFEPMC